MNKLLLPLLTTTALLASPVLAADLVLVDADPGVVEVAAFDWNGAYVGVNAGVAQGLFEHPFTIWGEDDLGVYDIIDGSVDVTAGGFVGGVTAGYNVQMDNFVVGVEGDLNGSTVDGRIAVSLGDDDITLDAGTSLDWFGTLRLRAGLLVTEQSLLYVTGGLAAGQTTSSVNGTYLGSDIFGDDLTEVSDRTGWTAGFGLEYALTDNVTIKTEYLYTDLGTATLFDDYLDGGPGDGFGATLDSSVAFHTVRAGLNFQF